MFALLFCLDGNDSADILRSSFLAKGGSERGCVLVIKESQFQATLIKDLKTMLPGCVVLKNDANYIQGIPDLTVLYEDKWAMLECKRSSDARKRPNQEYYIDKLGDMSFASFISQENKEEVLNELEQSFGFNRKACNT